MKITKQDFSFWKNQVVTKEFYMALEGIRTKIEEQMLSNEVISSPNGHLTLNRLAGIREGIDLVLCMSTDDFEATIEDLEE